MKRRFRQNRHGGQRGAALLFAIALLSLFSLLGAAWFQGARMALERRQIMEIRTRAMAAAMGGMETVAARLAASAREGTSDQVAGDQVLTLRNYGMAQEPGGRRDAAGYRPDMVSEARVSVQAVDPTALPGAPSDATACYVVRVEGVAYRLVNGRPYNRARWTEERGYASTQSGLRLVYAVSGGGAVLLNRRAMTEEHGNG
ncbi:MAG TPA: hypothetical protein PLO53_05510 [Candidatus Hydrogenedentes bacterium]|nr:hypothetical protein [Candidatus Hydrogenedentota bacterium]